MVKRTALWAGITAFIAFTASSLQSVGAQSVESPGGPCAPNAGLRLLCGAARPEDVVRIPGTRWIVFSGFNDGAGLKLVDTAAMTMKLWYAGKDAGRHRDSAMLPDCASPPDVALFNAQGLSLRTVDAGLHRLYVVNHGGRESIEVFSVDVRVAEPVLTWLGCVRMPAGLAANSVATYSDGTILASVLTHPGTSITDFWLGGITGGIYQWRPGEAGFRLLPGTALPGNNGLETSRDDKEFYVIAFGWRSVVVFSRDDTSHPIRKAVAPGFMPDNIHWDDRRLIVAGMQYDEPACGGTRKVINGKADDMRCHRGYTVAEVDPGTLAFKLIAYSEPHPQFNGVSAAVLVGNDLWLASYQANCVAVRETGD